MRKILNITLLWTAGLILFAHSVIPHIHHQVNDSHFTCEEDQPESVVEYLAEVFHNDLGSDHLEHFEVQKVQLSQSFFSDLYFITESYSLPTDFLQEKSFIPCANCFHLQDEIGIECMSLRGPPIV